MKKEKGKKNTNKDEKQTEENRDEKVLEIGREATQKDLKKKQPGRKAHRLLKKSKKEKERANHILALCCLTGPLSNYIPAN